MVDQLRDVVGPQVIVDQDVIASYTTDRTRRFVGRTAAVVRPGSTEEVARIVMVRLTCDPDTGLHGAPGKEGRSKREVVRSLKRYVVRKVYRLLPRP